jgi:hypothetical protein
MAYKVFDDRRDFDRILDTMVKASGNPSVKIGVLDDKKLHKKEGAQGSRPSTVLLVAATNEFGTNKAGKNHNIVIPERSFLRSTFDSNFKKWLKIFGQKLNRVIDGHSSIDQLLNFIGLTIEKDVKNKIRELKKPPNKPSTINKKKSSNPLVDTGQLVQSIRFAIEKGFGK